MLERQLLLPLLERALGHRPSPPTIWRWCNRGIKIHDRRVKLDAQKIGGRFYATPEAVEQFINSQNPPVGHDDDVATERSAETTERLATAGLLVVRRKQPREFRVHHDRVPECEPRHPIE
jgi:hypothetical protein